MQKQLSAQRWTPKPENNSIVLGNFDSSRSIFRHGVLTKIGAGTWPALIISKSAKIQLTWCLHFIFTTTFIESMDKTVPGLQFKVIYQMNDVFEVHNWYVHNLWMLLNTIKNEGKKCNLFELSRCHMNPWIAAKTHSLLMICEIVRIFFLGWIHITAHIFRQLIEFYMQIIFVQQIILWYDFECLLIADCDTFYRCFNFSTYKKNTSTCK